MSPNTELQSEIAKLRSELAALREEFNKVIRIDRDDDGTICSSAIRSTIISSENFIIENEHRKILGMMSSDEDGPCISLSGSDDRARLLLRVTQNAASVKILGDDLETAVEMFSDEDRQGNVVVFSPGNIPRALMKGMEKGGAVSALSPEGKTRAVLHSINDKGEVAVVGEKALAKMSATEGGGSLSIYDQEGKKGAAMMATPVANGIFVHPPGEEHSIQLVATVPGSSLGLGLVGEGRRGAVELMEVPGFGGQIICRDKTGANALDMGTAGEGGDITVANGASGGSIHLHTHDGGGIIEASRTDSSHRVFLSAARDGAIATVAGENETAAFMQITGKGGMFGLKKGDCLPGLLGVSDDGEFGTLMLTNPDNSNAVNLAAGKEGGRIILGSNDGTTQATLFTNGQGSQLTLFNELGIERATLVAKEDSGGLHLRYGGHTGIVAAATERGGVITLHDKEGELAQSIPGHGWEDADEE